MLKNSINISKIVCAVQSRINSSRFPEKCFALVKGRPLLQLVLERCLKMKIDECYLLVPNKEKTVFESFIKDLNLPITVFGGSEQDVLGRYAAASDFFSWQDAIMRVTGDNPLISVFLADQLAQKYPKDGIAHYLGNPLGTGVEIFMASNLLFASQNAVDPYEREHVTPYFYRHPELFRVEEWKSPVVSSLKLVTVDTPNDLKRVENILSVAPDWGVFNFDLPSDFIDS
ncbi:MAG: cytidylyltransferase domain-containing protein [Brevinema sp.]